MAQSGGWKEKDVEFASDDVMILTKEEAQIKETWTRVEP